MSTHSLTDTSKDYRQLTEDLDVPRIGWPSYKMKRSVRG